MRKRQGNLKMSARELQALYLQQDRPMTEGWAEGRLPVRPPSVTVTEAQVAKVRAERLAAERAKRLAVQDTRKCVVVPSLTEQEQAAAAALRAEREAARRAAVKAELMHKVNVRRIQRAMSGAL